MSRVPSVTLELLRGGPPHNQLISPITDYLALCGDASPHVLRLPFEHRDVTERLRALRYERADASGQGERTFELHRLGRDIGAILGAVPAFASEMTGLRPDGDEVVHLQLVLTGNELSILPWEASHIPTGLPGAGLPLLLNPGAPASLTREVRGASRRKFNWNRRPRVLFASTAASEFPQGTIEAHLLALMNALEHWAFAGWVHNGWQIRFPIDVVPCATIESIRRTCMRGGFTHVHLLAHGARLTDEADRFGVCLHAPDRPGEMEVVTGQQLAQALRFGCGGDRGGSDPVLVTLASCDTAYHGSVVASGGSIAHELHQYGIPWVVASQFPLTVDGSVVLVDELYSRLFRGEDPRRAVHVLRSRLAARFADRHDWATLVVYASMPGDFDVQVHAFRGESMARRRDQAYSLMDLLVLDDIDRRLRTTEPEDPSAEFDRPAEAEALHTVLSLIKKDVPSVARTRESIEEAHRAFQRERDDLDRELAGRQPNEAEQARSANLATNHGALLKRMAELQHFFPARGDDARATLRVALRCYVHGSAFGNVADHWAIGQVFVLDTVLGDERDPRRAGTRWQSACYMTEMRIESPRANERMWAWSTKLDLAMVAMVREWSLPGMRKPPDEAYVLEALEEMIAAGDDAIWPTFRQFWRYYAWWIKPAWKDTAEAGFRRLLQALERVDIARAVRVRAQSSNPASDR